VSWKFEDRGTYRQTFDQKKEKRGEIDFGVYVMQQQQQNYNNKNAILELDCEEFELFFLKL